MLPAPINRSRPPLQSEKRRDVKSEMVVANRIYAAQIQVSVGASRWS